MDLLENAKKRSHNVALSKSKSLFSDQVNNIFLFCFDMNK